MTDVEIQALREALLKRFAAGEIDAATYDRMRHELDQLSAPGGPAAQQTPAPGARETPLAGRPERHPSIGGWDTSLGMAPATELGGFRLETMIGRGGMGEVWKAYDPTAERYVVIKVVPPELQQQAEEMSRVKETFSRIHALHHQHICPVYLLGQAPGYGYFVVMKYIEGRSLSAYRNQYVLRHGKIPVGEVARLLAMVAAALDYAHAHRVVHRDIKPENLLVTGDGEDVQVIDFGLAAEIRQSVIRISKVKMETAGTYPYMAPEQWRGELQDAATDQYALGVVAYELLAGRLPFDTPDVAMMRLCVLNDPPPPLRDQPEHVNRALARALAKRREERFSSCAAFVEALARRPEEFVELHEVPERSAPPLPPPVQRGAGAHAVADRGAGVQPAREPPPASPSPTPTPRPETPAPRSSTPSVWSAPSDDAIRQRAPQEFAAWAANAQRGDPAAQYLVAMCYFHGWSAPLNAREGVKWLLFSAGQGCREAQYRLAVCYEKGVGIRASLIEAAKWHRKAGAQGIPEAKQHFEALPFWATLLQRLGLDG
jgi:serine/threonine-protein kinase